MKVDLASKIQRRSKRPIVLRPIQPTQAQANALATIYLRVVAKWREGMDRINAAYAKTLNELQTDSADDLKGAIDAVANEIQRLVILLTPDLRQWAVGVERVQRGKWTGNILSATDVDLSTLLSAGDVEDTLAAQIEWNVALIRDVSAEAQKRIANAVFAGLQQRKSARDVAKDIREAVDMSRARSIRIAADQTTKLGSRLAQARAEQAGLTHFKWRHSAKAHPRSWHLARNGKVYAWKNGGIPADDLPGIPPFCGCVAQSVILFGDEEQS